MRYDVTISELLNKILEDHLLRGDLQEYLCFALYNPSKGVDRFSGLVFEIILPDEKDQNLHGNVSFNSCYFDKITAKALESHSGIVFIHSHIGSGWQDMSRDDIQTEKMLASRVQAISGLPLLGMTIGNDGYWSARFWLKTGRKQYFRQWCHSVKIVGISFKIYYNDRLIPPPSFGVEFTRTISCWGKKIQDNISRLHVGVVGLGSVGSIIAESLMRTGVKNITLIDFDTIEDKNLDRLIYASKRDVGKLKVDFYKNKLVKNAPHSINVNSIPYAIMEENGFLHALDCDIIFSCVDKPWARFILDTIAYTHMIPVIDGGIDARINKKQTNIGQTRWKSHIVGPSRRCMNCLQQYKIEDVSLEQSGLLEDSRYIQNLPPEHFVNHGENVFSFSIGLASMEMHQFLSLLLKPNGVYYGPKEYDFISGNIDQDFEFECEHSCDKKTIIALGDKITNTLISRYPLAIVKRKEANKNWINRLFHVLMFFLKPAFYILLF